MLFVTTSAIGGGKQRRIMELSDVDVLDDGVLDLEKDDLRKDQDETYKALEGIFGDGPVKNLQPNER